MLAWITYCDGKEPLLNNIIHMKHRKKYSIASSFENKVFQIFAPKPTFTENELLELNYCNLIYLDTLDDDSIYFQN